MTKTRRAMAAAFFLLLTGCAYLSFTSVPDTSFASGKAVQAEMGAYYRDHGAEYNVGACNRPYFDAITKVEVLEDSAERLVLDIRYAYRDRLRDDENTRSRRPFSSRKLCRGFESRQFTLAKSEGDEITVVDMTGLRRGQASSPIGVTLGSGSN